MRSGSEKSFRLDALQFGNALDGEAMPRRSLLRRPRAIGGSGPSQPAKAAEFRQVDLPSGLGADLGCKMWE